MSRLLSAEERALYSRFAETLRDEDRAAFLRQLTVAIIEEHEPSYSYFAGVAAAPTFDTSAYRNNLVTAYYDDVDGLPVHVILHFAHGYVSWVERFRIDTSRRSQGRSKSPVEMAVPPASKLRFVKEHYALPPVLHPPDGFPRFLTTRERELYWRFCDALRTEDIAAFRAQISIATLVKHDSSHTSFGNVETAPTFDDGWYEGSVDAFYDDADHTTVHVIFHFGDGTISRIERYRLDMEPVTISTPDPADIRFVMLKI